MSAGFSDVRVLVIDDQRFQRTFLVRLLHELGVRQVFEACNGQNALETLAEIGEPLDLIISDIDMPKMDGLEFLRWLGRVAPGTAILIHSALEESLLQSVEAMAIEYGLVPVGVLDSPVTTAGLATAIERAQLQLPEARTPDRPQFTQDEVAAGFKRAEFEPWFQPKLELRTGRAIGMEVLMRWRRADGRTVLPGSFVPQLTAANLLNQATLQLATRSAECFTLLTEKESGFTFAINLSPVSLDDPCFARELEQALQQGGAKPENVLIEISESAMTHNAGAFLENVARLRMRGFAISIDDFCTGSSSMAQLTRSPVNELKIDRSFVAKMSPGNREWLLIESTVALAHRLGLRTVAEGVQTEQQLQALKQFGCDAAQGFLIARPMPIIELMLWLERASKNAETLALTSQRGLFGVTGDDLQFESGTLTTSGPGGNVKDWLDNFEMTRLEDLLRESGR
jgi:EAL domain-containing protein (putative c-di-GMP-specific phosphodiesterase class I)